MQYLIRKNAANINGHYLYQNSATSFKIDICPFLRSKFITIYTCRKMLALLMRKNCVDNSSHKDLYWIYK